jgi:hypothetical protein
MQTFEEYEAARADADQRAEDEIREYMVSGTYVGEKPVYFVVPRDLPDDQVAEAAFEIREGRKPSTYEHWLRNTAETLRQQ